MPRHSRRRDGACEMPGAHGYDARRSSPARLVCVAHCLRGGMSLRDELEAERRSLVQRRPELAVVYDDVVAHLARTGVAGGSLKAGDRMPDFMLPNAEGRLIASDELLARGPLVLSFFRGDWCPYCR